MYLDGIGPTAASSRLSDVSMRRGAAPSEYAGSCTTT